MVDRLLSAGAVILGKTNTATLGREWQTYNDLFPVTRNPWDLERTSGGSSGGCAAAVAAGLSYAGIGSDLAGSIRIPAAFCGIYGHKTSRRLVPSTGQIPPLPGQSRSGETPSDRGLFSRDARDLRLVLESLIGSEKQLPPARRTRISDYRVGYILDDPHFPVTGHVRKILEGLIETLRRAGVRLQRGWPCRGIVQQQSAVFRQLLHNPALAENWQRLKNLLSGDREHRTRARRIWQAYFETTDVFLLPAASVHAFPHDFTEPWYQRTINTPEGPQAYLNLSFWTSFATVAGLPATVAPAGLTRDGLPVGIQIIGPYYEDLTAIDFSARLAKLIGGFRPPGTRP